MNGMTLGEIMFEELMNDIENVTVLLQEELQDNMDDLDKAKQAVNRLYSEITRLETMYGELKEALVGDSDNWTHEELIEQILALVDIARDSEEAIE